MKTSRTLLESYLNAQNGVLKVLSKQRNFLIEIVVAVLVVAAGFILSINSIEWCIVLICIALVISLEATNSALENLADALKPEFHPLVGKAKDVAAGAVLVASVFAGIIGIIIFAPRFFAI